MTFPWVVYLKAVLLAIVEGATEFLPVSSTGHLIIVEEWVKLSANEAFADAFMIIIQLPAVLAVVVYFRHELWPLSKDVRVRKRRIELWVRIIVAFLPAAFIGFFLDDFIEATLFAPGPVAGALIVGGLLLLYLERRPHVATIPTVQDISVRTALYIGLFQCLAMFPGTSRSAATIIGAMLLGASRAASAEFSFFLAVPTMLGATTYKMLKGGAQFTAQEWTVLAVGSIVSFVVAYAVVAAFMDYIRRHDFKPFGYYRIVLGIVVLAYFSWFK